MSFGITGSGEKEDFAIEECIVTIERKEGSCSYPGTCRVTCQRQGFGSNTPLAVVVRVAIKFSQSHRMA